MRFMSAGLPFGLRCVLEKPGGKRKHEAPVWATVGAFAAGLGLAVSAFALFTRSKKSQ